MADCMNAQRDWVFRYLQSGTQKLRREKRDRLRFKDGVPYAVFLGDGVGFLTLGFDFDAKKVDRSQAERDSEDVREILDSLGIKTVSTRSGPGGGRHLIATFDRRLDPSLVKKLAELIKVRYPTFDKTPLCNVKTGALRPPGAPHRDGGESELLDPTDVGTAVAILAGKNPSYLVDELVEFLAPPEPPAPEEATETRTPQPVPSELVAPLTGDQAVLMLLKHGDYKEKYRQGDGTLDRSRLDAAVAYQTRRAEWSFERFAREMLNPANVPGEKAREKSESEAQAYLRRTWESAQSWDGNPDPPAELDESIATVAALARSPRGRTRRG